MAPSTTAATERPVSPKATKRQKLTERYQASSSQTKAITAGEAASDTASSLAIAFRQDLESIKTHVTCTICNQLLYEPWTLGCGHTYCYSCLCSWFVSNKRKKTCPDCRAPVTQIPATAYLVKQIVDTFINRSELMPADESTEQHKERRKEETDIVATDRASIDGLFKGCFLHITRLRGRLDQSGLLYDEEDHVRRCPQCGHEYEGGGRCFDCGTEFDEGVDDESAVGFTDMSDEMDSSEMDSEFGYDRDMIDDMAEEHELHIEDHQWLAAHLERNHGPIEPGSIHVGYTPASDIRRHGGIRPSSNNFYESQSDSEDEGSLRDFIEHDEEPRHNPASPINIDSSDDSDEARAIRPQNPHPQTARRPAPRSRTRQETRERRERREREESEARQQRILSHTAGGWSPLQGSDDDEGNEDEDEEDQPRSISGQRTDDSDTNTMVGNQYSDSSDHSSNSESEAPMSPTTRRRIELHQVLRNRQRESSIASATTDRSGYGYSALEDGEAESVVDEDGDVEMFAPRASRSPNSGSSASVEFLGSGRNVVDIDDDGDDDDSDDSIRPPRRRRHAGRRPTYTQDIRPSRPSATTSYSTRSALRYMYDDSARTTPSPYTLADRLTDMQNEYDFLFPQNDTTPNINVPRVPHNFRVSESPSHHFNGSHRTLGQSSLQRSSRRDR